MSSSSDSEETTSSSDCSDSSSETSEESSGTTSYDKEEDETTATTFISSSKPSVSLSCFHKNRQPIKTSITSRKCISTELLQFFTIKDTIPKLNNADKLQEKNKKIISFNNEIGKTEKSRKNDSEEDNIKKLISLLEELKKSTLLGDSMHQVSKNVEQNCAANNETENIFVDFVTQLVLAHLPKAQLNEFSGANNSLNVYNNTTSFTSGQHNNFIPDLNMIEKVTGTRSPYVSPPANNVENHQNQGSCSQFNNNFGHNVKLYEYMNNINKQSGSMASQKENLENINTGELVKTMLNTSLYSDRSSQSFQIPQRNTLGAAFRKDININRDIIGDVLNTRFSSLQSFNESRPNNDVACSGRNSCRLGVSNENHISSSVNTNDENLSTGVSNANNFSASKSSKNNETFDSKITFLGRRDTNNIFSKLLPEQSCYSGPTKFADNEVTQSMASANFYKLTDDSKTSNFLNNDCWETYNKKLETSKNCSRNILNSCKQHYDTSDVGLTNLINESLAACRLADVETRTQLPMSKQNKDNFFDSDYENSIKKLLVSRCVQTSFNPLNGDRKNEYDACSYGDIRKIKEKKKFLVSTESALENEKCKNSLKIVNCKKDKNELKKSAEDCSENDKKCIFESDLFEIDRLNEGNQKNELKRSKEKSLKNAYKIISKLISLEDDEINEKIHKKKSSENSLEKDDDIIIESVKIKKDNSGSNLENSIDKCCKKDNKIIVVSVVLKNEITKSKNDENDSKNLIKNFHKTEKKIISEYNVLQKNSKTIDSFELQPLNSDFESRLNRQTSAKKTTTSPNQSTVLQEGNDSNNRKTINNKCKNVAKRREYFGFKNYIEIPVDRHWKKRRKTSSRKKISRWNKKYHLSFKRSCNKKCDIKQNTQTHTKSSPISVNIKDEKNVKSSFDQSSSYNNDHVTGEKIMQILDRVSTRERKNNSACSLDPSDLMIHSALTNSLEQNFIKNPHKVKKALFPGEIERKDSIMEKYMEPITGETYSQNYFLRITNSACAKTTGNPRINYTDDGKNGCENLLKFNLKNNVKRDPLIETVFSFESTTNKYKPTNKTSETSVDKSTYFPITKALDKLTQPQVSEANRNGRSLNMTSNSKNRFNSHLSSSVQNIQFDFDNITSTSSSEECHERAFSENSLKNASSFIFQCDRNMLKHRADVQKTQPVKVETTKKKRSFVNLVKKKIRSKGKTTLNAFQYNQAKNKNKSCRNSGGYFYDTKIGLLNSNANCKQICDANDNYINVINNINRVELSNNNSINNNNTNNTINNNNNENTIKYNVNKNDSTDTNGSIEIQQACRPIVPLKQTAHLDEEDPWNGETLLMRAVLNKSHKQVEDLLFAGCTIDRIDYKGRTALTISISLVDVRSTCMLLKHGSIFRNIKALQAAYARCSDVVEFIKLMFIISYCGINLSRNIKWWEETLINVAENCLKNYKNTTAGLMYLEKIKFISHLCHQPPTLLTSCMLTVRGHLLKLNKGRSIVDLISHLPLPKRLISILSLDNIEHCDNITF
ncbi:hypothetical protein HELRODRAFT_193572 [Helobdella robusta]|uniref:Uncharacterized protein n=1 Tax=Helobdella robusta TaxID=6412 RepID=T1FV51_HELRO|nr:hypothetical protein HELRODRAFT_193572 [Helobdella robusta]ESN95387.1 hypothetical protein HELRODRAFT_193572 [Helobdella robusta]